MNAYIFSVESKPIGYIQYYNKHDFPREHDYAMELPESCAAIDWYIGEPEFVGRGIGTKALKLFLDIHVFSNFDNVFVDPDTANVSAICVYEKTGFITISKTNDDKVTLMLKTKI
jgi:aminoglycoside 6'-N-acetyltransferase